MTDRRSYPSQTPDSVISAYVDDLLSVDPNENPYVEEVHTPAPSSPRPLAEPPASQVKVLRELPPVAEPEPDPEPVPEPEPEPEPEPVPEPEPDVAEPSLVATPEPAPEADRWPNGRPTWAQQGFECLIFRVAGLQLAVPLVLLGAIHRLDRDLTPLFGRPQWFMGLLQDGDQTINVADTARWVMPERYRSEITSDYQFVIRLDQSQWGLACDEVAQSFTVHPDDVKWRTSQSRRKWLAGTVREQMCALLDVSELARMLAEAEKGQRFDLENG